MPTTTTTMNVLWEDGLQWDGERGGGGGGDWNNCREAYSSCLVFDARRTVIQTTLYLIRFSEICFCFDQACTSISNVGSRDLAPTNGQLYIIKIKTQLVSVQKQIEQRILIEKTRWANNGKAWERLGKWKV